MWLFLKFLLAVVLTEAITEIVTKSEIFSPLRAKIFGLGQNNKLFNWLHGLLDCGYCFSVWAGVFTAILFFRDINIIHISVDWFFVGLVLHRLSNLFHNYMDKVYDVL